MPVADPDADRDEVAVRDALAAHARTRAFAHARLQPLGGGLGNRTWRIDTADESVVARLNAVDR